METTVGMSRKKKLLGIGIIVLVVVLAAGAGIGLRWWQNRDAASNTGTSDLPPEPESVESARSLLMSGKLEDAEKAVQAALNNPAASKKEQYALYIEQGRIAHEKDDYQGAIDAFTKAWDIEQTFDVARRLGSMWQQAGNNEKALEFYKKAMELNPRSSPTYESDNNVLKQMVDILEGGQ